MRKFKILAVVVIVQFAFCALSFAKDTKDDLYNQLELLSDAIVSIQDEYVKVMEPKELIYGALKGMLSSLDAHSQFMDPETYKDMKVETEGEFGGLGIEISIKDDLLTIVSPIDDTPAYKAGLKAGDRIVKIDNEITRGITIMDAVKKLRGKPETDIKLTILRESEDRLLDFTITRKIIKIQSVRDSKILKGNIGYIKLTDFSEKTPKDLDLALKKLKEQNMDSLIFDLRNNPGGLLNISVEVASRFLPKGTLIVSTKGRTKTQNFEFRSHGDPDFENIPIVVLINNGSASASEIVAGAFKDDKRAILVGEKSFGKGSVQTIIPLKDGSALRLTTALYYTPSGRSIHGEGIMPDVEVKLIETKEDAKGETKEKNDKVFEKVNTAPEDKKTEEKYDNQLTQAIYIIEGIKAYDRLKNTKG